VPVTDADDLYGLPLGRFVFSVLPWRRACAALVTAAGLSGWPRCASRRLARGRSTNWRAQSAALAELFAAGNDLAEAQADLLAGRGDPAGLRAAAQRERDAVDRLTASARGLLSGDGHDLSPAALGRVAGTLHAGALDRRSRDQVTAARLERDLRHVGLGSDSVIATPGVVTSVTAAPAGASPSPDREAEAERIRSDAAQRERAERKRSRRLAAARRAERQARRRMERADRDLTVAQEHRDRAAEALRVADAALTDARKHARAAVEAHRCAQDELERASRDPAPGGSP
jgi:hypothetical protein